MMMKIKGSRSIHHRTHHIEVSCHPNAFPFTGARDARRTSTIFRGAARRSNSSQSYRLYAITTRDTRRSRLEDPSSIIHHNHTS
jgi:hypothetical protein